ncbi:hypothetical protein Syun_026070 [Stephania yunnanensis]|uniref:Malic enzyme n=1 Tax=Stephania yunnanensis TaxID=152371 RepID=A0AAP0ESV2_9MAGN
MEGGQTILIQGAESADAPAAREGKTGRVANGQKTVSFFVLSYDSGFSLLRDSHHNKGLAFTEKERDIHYLRGLLSPVVLTQELQEKKLLNNIREYEVPLQKYVALMDLQERNERLFYKLLIDNVEELLPIVYTPTVGEACQKGKVLEVSKNWPEKNVQVIVATNGERILGLVDLGCQGMGIPVGKLALYTTLGGLRPCSSLAITIDVGTNNEECLKDEFYIGLKQKRATGHINVKQNYGGKVLIQAGISIAEFIALVISKQEIKPTILIGSSGVGKTFTKEVIQSMASFKKKPIILALSNPTSRSECTPEEAYKWSEGCAIFASGSPFGRVEYNGKVCAPGQANSAYIFPGFGLGLVISGAIRVHEGMLLAASEALAAQVAPENLEKVMIYPPFSSIRKISAHIAANVAAKAYGLSLATCLSRPENLEKYELHVQPCIPKLPMNLEEKRL